MNLRRPVLPSAPPGKLVSVPRGLKDWLVLVFGRSSGSGKYCLCLRVRPASRLYSVRSRPEAVGRVEVGVVLGPGPETGVSRSLVGGPRVRTELRIPTPSDPSHSLPPSKKHYTGEMIVLKLVFESFGYVTTH